MEQESLKAFMSVVLAIITLVSESVGMPVGVKSANDVANENASLNETLSEYEMSAIRGMLYVNAAREFESVSQLSERELALDVMTLCDVTYLTINAVNLVPYTTDYTYDYVTADDMKEAMHYLYGRQLSGESFSWDEDKSADRYAVRSNNGRGFYGEVVIDDYTYSGGKLSVDYAWRGYDTPQEALDRTPSREYSFFADFEKTDSEKYPFRLLSVKAPEKPEGEKDYEFVGGLWFDYSPQYAGGEAYEFMNDGKVIVREFSFSPFRYYGSRYECEYTYNSCTGILGIYSDSYSRTFLYDEGHKYIYIETETCTNGYLADVDTWVSKVPGEELKFIPLRKIMFHYDDAPSDEQMAHDLDSDYIKEW